MATKRNRSSRRGARRQRDRQESPAAQTRRSTAETSALAAQAAPASYGEASTAPAAVVTSVAKPTITLIEFADQIKLNINSLHYKHFAWADGMAVRELLMRIAEQTEALAVVHVDHRDLDS